MGTIGGRARCAPGCGSWHHSDKDYPQGRASRQGEEKACPPTGAGEGRVASVIWLNSGGSTAIEKMGLSVEQAKELATHLWEAGEPKSRFCQVPLFTELPSVLIFRRENTLRQLL